MKKILLLGFVFYMMQGQIFSQQLKASDIDDWNNIRHSGFVQSTREKAINAPSTDLWYWGINVNHPNGGTHNGQIAFAVNWSDVGLPVMYVRSTSGNGAAQWAKVLHSKGNHAIDGKLTAKEIQIKIDKGADFVFNPDYQLTPLSEVESFVKENKHLPEIPSEKQMIEEGVSVNDMQIKLLQKIEELTLYVIEMDKENKEIKAELNNLKNK